MKRERGYTLAELLITITILVLVVLFLAQPAGKKTRGKAQRIKCVNNLKNLSLALRNFPQNNDGNQLAATFTNLNGLTVVDYFRSLSNELSAPNLLICPADATRRAAVNFQQLARTNLSYFANPRPGPGAPHYFLFGDRNLMANGFPVPSGARLKIGPEMDLGWTSEMHNGLGHVAFNDGSVQMFSSARLREALQVQAGETNLLLIP